MYALFAALASLPLLAQAPAPAAKPAPAPDGNKLVQLKLLADHETIRPDEQFSIAVQLSVDAGWHIYWENPGDGGLPTKVAFSVPEEFERGFNRFPGPERNEEEGDIVTYVLSGAPMIVLDVQAPPKLAPGAKLRFAVECDWLVCKGVCLKGAGKAELELTAASAGDAPRPANEKLFAAAQARLPRPFAALAEGHAEWLRSDEHPLLQIVVMQAKGLEFFPYLDPALSFTKRSLQTFPDNCKLDVVFDYDRQAGGREPEAHGVLLVRAAGGETFYDLRQRLHPPLR